MQPTYPAHIRRPKRPVLSLVLAGMITLGATADALSASATLTPSKDATIFGDGSANLTDGAGAYLLAGRSGERRVLRSLVAFDFAGRIPAGATITEVRLSLAINTPLNRANTVRLHRLLADWGEGTVVAPMGGGGGALATTGSVTWNHRFFNASTWSTPGGDFSGSASASAAIAGQSGTAVFSSAGLVADVQAWVDNPGSNFGWILVAQNEDGPAVRFASRQGSPAPLLTVEYTVGGPGGNTAPTITAQPVSQVALAGATAVFTVGASGTPAPTYQWQKDGATLGGATSATLTLPNVSSSNAGSYSVLVSNAAGNVTSTPATLTVTNPGASTARLSNLSVRAAMAADQTLIVGFAVRGGSRPVVIRGVGPTLQGFGLSGTMADPRLELYNGGALVTQNDNWGDNAVLSTAFGTVGAFPLAAGSNDAALLQSLDGSHSVQLRGTTAGVVLVELYDAGSGGGSRLVNVSARNEVGTGDNILIFGFVVDGVGAKNVLIRAIGPGLVDFGITNALADPRLELFRANVAAAIAGNDNWDGSLAGTFSTVGAFSLTTASKDAALVTSLTPGAYTVQVSGVNNATGEALVEIYELP